MGTETHFVPSLRKKVMPLPSFSPDQTPSLLSEEQRVRVAIHSTCRELVREFCRARKDAQAVAGWPRAHQIDAGALEESNLDDYRERLRVEFEKHGIDLESAFVRQELQQVQDSL